MKSNQLQKLLIVLLFVTIFLPFSCASGQQKGFPLQSGLFSMAGASIGGMFFSGALGM